MKFSNTSFTHQKQIVSKQSPSVLPTSSSHQSLLNQTIDQRRRLKAAEYSSADPVKSHAQQRGELLERRISQLQQQTKNDQR